MQTELDSLEAQIEQVNTGKAKLSEAMQAKNDSLQSKIKVLRQQLAKGKLTQKELDQAQEDVKQLRYFVTKYTADIEELKKQNATLASANDTLKSTLVSTTKPLPKRIACLPNRTRTLAQKLK